MTEHTPGPWQSSEYGIRGEDGPIGFMINGDGVAIALTDGYSARDAANAHLVVAAPDLLAACETVHDVIKASRQCYCTLGEPSGCMLATAIAKAKGAGA